ncbi:DUF4179 domain-containing protein [Paenibacillus sp. M1]|uniref:DUF4179 domain-containing protein n=1 Tax=Paenibacillus haidiansis TaxID=1574488 RepID=A0ABU7VU66_9BACL
MDRIFKSKINESIEAQVAKTDFESMWNEIEREASYRKAMTNNSSAKGKKIFNRKWAPAGLALACFMFIAVPVFAGVALNWNRIMGFTGIHNALANGYGQQYEASVTNAGISMGLHAVVTDGEKFKALVSFDADSDLSRYDAYGIGESEISDDQGNAEPVRSYLYYDRESGKLLGIFETKDMLRQSEKNLSLTAESLIFYKYKEIPLTQELREGAVIPTGTAEYPEMTIQSLMQDEDRFTIRYILKSASGHPKGLDPHLTIHGRQQGEENRGQMTVLPYDGEGMFIEQVFEVFEQPEMDFSDPGVLNFKYLKEAKTTEGSWSLAFKADGKRASKPVYTRTLDNGGELSELTGINLTKLSVSPLKITLDIDEDHSMERFKKGVVWYDSVTLMAGGKEIRGNYNIEGDRPEQYQHVYQFEPSVWYEDWSEVPMKLILKDAEVTKRDTGNHWMKLNTPTEAKQLANMNVDGYLIHFSYYLDGGDLIVESWSDSPGFQGVGQSMLRVNGVDIYPEPGSGSPVYTGKTVERYKEGAEFKDIQINPGFYSFSDPGLDMEVDLKE